MILNIPGIWICHWYWICHGTEYTRVLIMSELWICQGYKYTKVLNMHLFLNMPECWIYQGSEYRATYLNKASNLKKHEAVSLKWKKLDFPIVLESIWFAFCLAPNIFISKISNSLLPLRADEGQHQGRDPWISIYQTVACKT